MVFGVIIAAVRMRHARVPRQAVLVRNGRQPSWPREGIKLKSLEAGPVSQESRFGLYIYTLVAGSYSAGRGLGWG